MRWSAGAIAVLVALAAGCASDGDRPTASDPASSDPASSDPASSDVSASSDPVTDTGAAETASSDPVSSDPASSDVSASSDPVTDTGAAETASSDPVSSDPASSDPASSDVSASSDPATDTGAAETGSVASDAPAGVRPEGFTTVTVRVVDADGDVCEVCMWLADDGDERGRGLMGVTDLGAPAGMAFRFPEPIEGAFFMFGTPTPLSIAWFAPDGALVSATDMDPCTTAAADCERFRAGGAYQLAIEVFRGGLDDLGIGPGATAELVAGTESDDCVLAP